MFSGDLIAQKYCEEVFFFFQTWHSFGCHGGLVRVWWSKVKGQGHSELHMGVSSNLAQMFIWIQG